MASLAEFTNKDLIKILVYGEPGAGKTCFAASFPSPILYFDFDNKISSAARFYAKDTERLKQIELVSVGPHLSEDPLNKFNLEINNIIKMQKEKKYPYKTLVIDSITTFSAAVLSHIVKTNPGIKRMETRQGVQPGQQDFGILKREFAKLIPGILSLEMNIVMLGHIAVDKDEYTGQISRGILMDGSFAQQLPTHFEEVYRGYVEDRGGTRNYLLQTKPDQMFSKIRSQIPGLPAIIPMKYEELTQVR